eukprot:TRINITY_DN749_c0_g1_i1.p1 TRINITY_DN749_c0_g1~~TRINITY_DN749_c0_g1_i1.p1  ORF type:complete len:643 (+),score=118.00 TRINITY_DN749_c0_g1_i1:175-2103(+)
MDGLQSLGKRSYSQVAPDTNDKSKRQKPPPLPGANSTAYRLLCPADILKSVIGKGGKVINSMRQETKAKIVVPSNVTEGEERLVIIFSTPKQNKDNNEDDDNDESAGEEEFVCPAQDGLIRVHTVIANEVLNKPSSDKKIKARLLVPKSQIGSLIGKAGNTIKQMKSDSGANIQVQRNEKLPAFALNFDELVQITGEAEAVKKGLLAVSELLHKNPPKETIPWSDMVTEAIQASVTSSAPLLPPTGLLPPGGSLLGQQGLGTSFLGVGSQLSGLGSYSSEAGNPWALTTPSFPLSSSLLSSSVTSREPVEFSLKVLCPKEKIGGVIGKGGNAIKALRQETGTNINVDKDQASEERVIVISANELPDARVSPVLEAALILQPKISPAAEKEGAIVMKLFAPSNQVGCLLGKGGSVIAEMRKKTRAHIKLYSKDERPNYVPENEELLQITGEPAVAKEALIEIVTRLRDNLFKDKDKDASAAAKVPSNLSSLSMPPTVPLTSSYQSSYAPRLDVGSGFDGARPSVGYSSIGSAQGGGIGSNPSLSAYSPLRSFTGSSLGSRGPTQMTVPADAVSHVIGRGGNNISKIRQVSGADVKVLDPLPGSLDRVIELTGTLEQVNSARRLVQAFILTGQAQEATRPGRVY